MQIRPETPSDHAAIAALTAAAFAGAEHSDGSEPAIIARLRADQDITHALVTEEAGQIIGHAAFSPVTIDGKDHGWFGLGPISVRPDHQKHGVGGALIQHGLALLRAQGAAGCVVLGDPAYYTRFGFTPYPVLRYEGPPPEYFMALPLSSKPVPQGRIDYAPAFNG